MGWLALALLGAAAMAGLALLGVGRALWSFAGAALMLGAAGYALQGTPMQPGHPAVAAGVPAIAPDDPAIIELRDTMLGRISLDHAYLVAADAMTNSGNPKAAVQVLLGGISKLPKSYALWTGLGDVYARHDRTQVSPPSRFAFEQAMRLAPNHPGPPFFFGLAQVRAGDFAAARPLWARALRLTPPALSYRREIALRLALLDRVLAMQDGTPGPR